MIHIREAAEQDLDRVAAVWLAGWQATGLAEQDPADVNNLRARLDEELARGWTVDVACAGDLIVGMMATEPDTISQLFLAPAWIGKGIGHALFDRARQRLPSGFTLWTQPGNARARAFYEAHGMTLDCVTLRPDKDEMAAFYRWEPDGCA